MHNGALLDACGSLVTYNERTGVIILSHFSVKVSYDSRLVCPSTTQHLVVQEYLIGELILKKLPQYHIRWEHAHLQLLRSCMCYLSISVNSPPDVSPRFGRGDCLHGVSETVHDYVLNDAIDHFQHLGSQFRFVLDDIKALAASIQRHPGRWDSLCRSTRRIMGSATPSWPTSKHDLMLYVLVAFAPNSLLKAFLRDTALRPKDGMNPLVYAAYFNKEEHARTLMWRGARLNHAGWEVNGFFQILPIEVALQARSYAVATLFVQDGCAIPSHTFTDSFFRRPYCYVPSSFGRMLLQTDDFVEAANDPFNETVPQPFHVFSCLESTESTYEPDVKEILRRFVQVVDNSYAHDLPLLRSVVEAGQVSIVRYLLSLGAPGRSLPSDLFGTFNPIPHGRWTTPPMIQFLLVNGANFHVSAARGDPVLCAALLSSSNESDTLNAIKLLVNHGCDPFKTSFRKTPLHIAVQQGLLSVVQYLLSLGVPPTSDLLLVAARLGNEQKRGSMVVLLLKSGADLHARTKSGNSLLHTALRKSIHDFEALIVAKLFVGHGCDPLKPNSYGKTPLRVALERGFPSTAQYLLSLSTPPPPDPLHIVSGPENVQDGVR